MKQLLSWYARHQRLLPWRETRDPYRIWISEIMLQQTQVVTVIPYYKRFIKQFPRTTALAQAPIQKVLKSWEGMGYYQRARNLHKAARIILSSWSGKVPSDPKQLQTLPGIGRSTAGAIASIAFGKRAPILDGNVRRVLCRVFAVKENPRLPHVQDHLWKRSEDLLPVRKAGTFNQALMDLGAVVCLPKNPLCPHCPVRTYCLAHRADLENKIPIKGTTRPIPHNRMLVGIMTHNGNLLMGRRPDQGLLGGLWGFPEISTGDLALDKETLRQTFGEQTGLDLEPVGALNPIVHTYSHQQVTYLPYFFRCAPVHSKRPSPWQWISWKRLSVYPYSVVTRRILDQLKQQWPTPKTLGLEPYRRLPSFSNR